MSFQLNHDQERAATTLDRSVVVTAGAGSGKTRVLTQRFINAVVPGTVAGWDAAGVDEILAITFTEKAAGELAERVRGALRAEGRVDKARQMDSAWVSTIHGLCSRLLRRHAIDAGIDPLFGVAETVVAGTLRARAFEEAALALIRDDDAAAGLFDAYSFPAVFSATSAISRELAVHGLGADAIRLEPAASAEKLLDQAVALFAGGCSACSDYAGTAKGPADFTERCNTLLGRALDLQERALGDEALEELGRLVSEYRPLRSSKGLEELSAESREAGERLAGAVGAALVEPHARALAALAVEYNARFIAMKRSAGVLDFDDLQLLAVGLLEARPDLARRYRERFRLVMIDEFQDTDALQMRLVAALSDDDLCTVGDEKQSIYRFRGAEIGVYRQHRAAMEAAGAEEVKLGVNYRSHRDVLSFVNAVFGSREYFAGDLLRLVVPEGERAVQACDRAIGSGARIEATFVDTSGVGTRGCREAEAVAIATRLREMCDLGVSPGDVAILMRSYTNAHVYANALAAVGIPAVVVGGSRFFGLGEVAVVRALTRVLANPSDGEALGQLLVSEFCPISDDGLARLRVDPDGIDRRPLWQLLREARDRLDGQDESSARRLVALVDRATQTIGARSLSDVLLGAVEDSGWDLRLLSDGNVGRDAFANVLKFARLADSFEASGGSGPAGFSAYLDTKEELGDAEAPAALADDEAQAVRIMSVHASKGLEFPVVVVPDLASSGRGGGSMVRMSAEEGRLRVALSPPTADDGAPIPKSAWTDELSKVEALADAEESDRVLYVAFTRARDLLLVSGSTNLRPKNPPTSKSHLIRLSRLLGVAVPIDGTCDMETCIQDAGEPVRVRVRVLDAAEVLGNASSADTSAELVCFDPLEAGERFVAALAMHDAPARTSYSRLHIFEQCPQRYLYEDVLGFRRAEIAEPGAADPTRFGSALHVVLQLAVGGVLPGTERLDAIGSQFGLDAGERARLLAAAESVVGSEPVRRANAAERTVQEMAFTLPVASGTCVLTGAVDLYARTGSGALIVDYKSGRSGDESALGARYELQASCYALAAFADGADRVEIVFTRPEVHGADGSPQEVRFEFGESDAPALGARIEAVLSAIATSEFAHIEEFAADVCGSCPVVPGLCPNARR